MTPSTDATLPQSSPTASEVAAPASVQSSASYAYPSNFSDAMIDAFAGLAAEGCVLPYIDMPLQHASDRVLTAMRDRVATTRLVVTNDPMYAFRAGFVVPPAVAALPLLRIVTDPDLGEEIRTAFAGHAPEQVVITPHAAPQLVTWIKDAMADRYELALDEDGTKLYVLSH